MKLNLQNKMCKSMNTYKIPIYFNLFWQEELKRSRLYHRESRPRLLLWPEFPQLWKFWKLDPWYPVNCILWHKFSLFYTILTLFHNFFPIFTKKKLTNFKKCSGHTRGCMVFDSEIWGWLRLFDCRISACEIEVHERWDVFGTHIWCRVFHRGIRDFVI